MKRTLLPLAMLALTTPAIAQDCPICRKDDGSTALTLAAEARRTVAQDRVMATLNIEGTGKTVQEAQAQVNGKMQQARSLYSKVSGLKVTTGGYNTWKNYPPEPAPKADGTPRWSPAEREAKAFWQANQQLNLDGANRDEVLKVVGALQQAGFGVNGINFYLSREASDALRDELTTEALKNIKSRASTMAKALGMDKVRFVRIDTNGFNPQPMPYNMMARAVPMAAKDESMPEPVAQGGESDVTVNVTAEVRLSE
ncbi:MAG: SIMPL domain-containing protein [Alphaproteobacteria bacterium]|nr:SIMPL domain-containing protein [Alphaproteobacteria bacterium]